MSSDPLCPLCLTAMLSGDRLHSDHIIPRADGGSDDPSNRRTVHGSCNELRGAARADCLTPSPRGEEGPEEATRRRNVMRRLAIDDLCHRRRARPDTRGAIMRRLSDDEIDGVMLWDEYAGGSIIEINRDETGWYVCIASL